MTLDHRLRPSIMMALVIATAMGCSLVMDEPALRVDSAAAGGTIKGTVSRVAGGAGAINSAQRSDTGLMGTATWTGGKPGTQTSSSVLANGGDISTRNVTVLASGGTSQRIESTAAGGTVIAETGIHSSGAISTATGTGGSSGVGGVTLPGNISTSPGGTESIRTSAPTGGTVATSINLASGGTSTVVATGGGGTATTGGTTGSGGTTTRTTTTPAKLANGASCTTKSQCASDYCVDGYCCNTPCDGVCASCSLTPGTCSKPATDSACIGAASCPADTICVDYTLTTTRGECSGLGSCAQACSQTFAPARTSCANSSDTNDGRICDGGGNCKQPQVTCGAGSNTKTCDTYPGSCCRDWDPSSSTGNWTAGATQCSSSSTCASSVTTRATVNMRCDSVDDCAAGKVCCLVQNSITEYTACRDTCIQPNGGTTGYSLLCRIDADCAAIPGTVCRAKYDFPEFRTCQDA